MRISVLHLAFNIIATISLVLYFLADLLPFSITVWPTNNQSAFWFVSNQSIFEDFTLPTVKRVILPKRIINELGGFSCLWMTSANCTEAQRTQQYDRVLSLVQEVGWENFTFPHAVSPVIQQTLVCRRLDFFVRTRLEKAEKYRKRMQDDFCYIKNGSCPPDHRPFLTIHAPQGRLGNFMFEMASFLGVARKNDRIPVVFVPDPRQDLFEGMALEWVNISQLFMNGTAEMLEKVTVTETGPLKFTPSVLNLTSLALKDPNETAAVRGYLQSWKYFHDFRHEIRAMLTFRKATLQKARDITVKGLEQIASTRKTSASHKLPILVGVHVRRGDITSEEQQDFGNSAAALDYVLRRFLRVQMQHPTASFFVVSDDIYYCKKILKDNVDNVVFVTDGGNEVDMAVLSMMDVVIITTGSYGWWGAYLSDAREVYYYKDWPRMGTPLYSQIIPEDYFPRDWMARL